MYEPFAGSAALSLYAAYYDYADQFVIGESCESIVDLWSEILTRPEYVARRYEELWEGQKHGDTGYFNQVREEYNSSNDPVLFLYLAARCVKNAIRFNRYGQFTQSVDKRRKGMRPDKMYMHLTGASRLLAGRTKLFKGDFKDCISGADNEDLIYMDPPYQGTTYGRDKRYYKQLEREDLCEVLYDLNIRRVDYLLSYDGKSGEKQYGEKMPEELELVHVLIDAGRSSQATLNGREEVTVESLYISPTLGCERPKSVIDHRDRKSGRQLLFDL